MANALSQRAEFEVFKQRLLLQRLDEEPNTDAHALLFNAADEAGQMAKATGVPWLVFPCLFAERANTAARFAHSREAGYWSSLQVPDRASLGDWAVGVRGS